MEERVEIIICCWCSLMYCMLTCVARGPVLPVLFINNLNMWSLDCIFFFVTVKDLMAKLAS